MKNRKSIMYIDSNKMEEIRRNNKEYMTIIGALHYWSLHTLDSHVDYQLPDLLYTLNALQTFKNMCDVQIRGFILDDCVNFYKDQCPNNEYFAELLKTPFDFELIYKELKSFIQHKYERD